MGPGEAEDTGWRLEADRAVLRGERGCEEP